MRCRFPLRALLQQIRLFLERAVDFAVHPPTGQRGLGGTAEQLVPKPDAPVNAFVQIVAGQQSMLVQPATDILPLKPVMQQTGKRLVRVVLAHEEERIERSWRMRVVKTAPPIFRIHPAHSLRREFLRGTSGQSSRDTAETTRRVGAGGRCGKSIS